MATGDGPPSGVVGRARAAVSDWAGSSLSVSTVVAAALPSFVFLLLLRARRSGAEPFGSDNDEYRLLARSVWHGTVEIAGVEATKYPIGYSTVLGFFDLLGVAMTPFAIGLNLALVAGFAVIVWKLLPPATGLVGRSVAAIVVIASVTVWDSVFMTMPDIALTAVVAAVVWQVGRLDSERSVKWLLVLIATATLLKSVGLIVAVAASIALWRSTRWRRWALAPAAVAAVITGAQALWASRYPEHTTGYNRTFWLADPFNQAGGRIGVLDLPERIIERFDLFLADVKEAVVGTHHTVAGLTVLTVALIAFAALTLRSRRTFIVTFVGLYAVFLSAWPYNSGRFGMVLLPLAAVGAGAVADAVACRTRPVVAVVFAALVLVPHIDDVVSVARDHAETEAVQVARYEAAIAAADIWLTDNADPADTYASFDYRELAYRTDREYLPIGYTSDHDEIWAASAGRGATWLVVLRDLYNIRDVVVNGFLGGRAEDVRLEADLGLVAIYRLLP